MPNSIKAVIALGFAALLTACAQQAPMEEEVMHEDTMVMEEEAMTKL